MIRRTRSNVRGRRVGIFGMANGFARSDRLSPDDLRWWRTNNDWFDAAYTGPSMVDPTIFDKSFYPQTSCWFKESARRLLDRVRGYLALLDRYGVAWVERRCRNPGKVIYADTDQVVLTPHDPSHEYRSSGALAERIER